MESKRPAGIERCDHPAGGWDALKAVAKTLDHQQIVPQDSRTLLKANQPEGIDCPDSAWPDPKAYGVVQILRKRGQGNHVGADREKNGRHLLRTA